MELNLDRRDFLKSAAVAGAAIAASGAVTAAPAVAEEAEGLGDDHYRNPHQANAHVTDFRGCTYNTEEPAPLAEADITWDEEYDIVVCGTGGGLAGAARAAYLGKSVCALEASLSYGGTSQEACLYYMATGTKCQLDAGLPDITDMLKATLMERYPARERYSNHIDNCLQGMRDLVAWTEELGMEWEPGWVDGEQKVVFCLAPKGTEEGGNSYRMQKTTQDFYNKVFTENGGVYKFETPVTALVANEEGRIVGVQATPDGADPIYIKANLGVLLATGGMCNNPAMLEKYCPQGLYQSMVSNAGLYDNGDGIRLGFGAGAALDGYNNHGHFDGGIENVSWNHPLYNSDSQIARQPWLQMDITGEQVNYKYDAYEAAGEIIMNLPGSKVYSFFDGNWEQYCDEFELPMCRNLTKPTMPNQERWGVALDPDYKNGVRQAMEEGRIKQGNTPEELAEAMGIDPALVIAAFEKWNAEVADAENCAESLGYKPEWMHPLDTPPFYGQALGIMMYSTRSGLMITENQQVMAESGAVIPGLYAAGMVTGRPAAEGPVCGDVGYAAVSAWLAVNHMVENA